VDMPRSSRAVSSFERGQGTDRSRGVENSCRKAQNVVRNSTDRSYGIVSHGVGSQGTDIGGGQSRANWSRASRRGVIDSLVGCQCEVTTAYRERINPDDFSFSAATAPFFMTYA